MTRKLLIVMCLLSICPMLAMGQSTTTGSILGTVTDPSGAAVANAPVTITDLAKGTKTNTTTNATGAYEFHLVAPSSYQIQIQAAGFRPYTARTTVGVGQAITVNAQLALPTATTNITVTETLPLIQTNTGNVSTTLNSLQVSQVPNPGNDITYSAQLAPGSTMNTQAGYGNFANYGTPATSNFFTLDSMADNDPFFNLNNSGATNLLLGQNEIQEVSVVSNGYDAEYGELAGANVNYVTKSGSNGFHGDLNYYYNGRALNANDFFNNASDTPRPFDISNQWGADFGGPIKKNKLFFYVDTEGLYITLPTSAAVDIPTPAFESAVLAGLPTSVAPFYTTMFNLYNAAPGAPRAQDILPPGVSATGAPTGDGCSNYAGIGTATCAVQFRSATTNSTHEWLLSGRVDYNIGANDRAFLRYQMDRGVQASYTDPINSLFNITSNQPEYQAQFEETHTFGPDMVNQFIASGHYYSAIFNNPDRPAAIAAFPTTVNLGDSSLYSLGYFNWNFPQGRNVTQYQVNDDLSKTMGNHALKFGVLFLRSDVTDKDYGINTSGTTTANTLGDFAAGGITGDSLVQTFPSSLSQPIAIWNLGAYVQDEYRIKPTFSLTYGLRIEHFSNPVCQHNCFARLPGPFDSIRHNPTIPYNASILTGQSQAIQGLQAVAWEPRIGFAWQPFGKDTVIRGGFGLFADQFPGSVADNFSENPPVYQQFSVANSFLTTSTAVPNLFSTAAGANAAFLSGFSSGMNVNQITAAVPSFVPPGFATSDQKNNLPTYLKWSLGVQHQFGTNTSVDVQYVGNHGYNELVVPNTVNAYCPPTVCPAGFVGLPSTPVDPRFGPITTFTSVGISNYEGVTASATHRYKSGLIQANYTFSHALDDVSNAGVLPFNFDTNYSLLSPQNPNCIRCFYGNSDYDARHYVSVNYVWELPISRLTSHHGPAKLLDGWQVSGTLLARSGLPFSVVDGPSTAALIPFNFGVGNHYTQLLPTVLVPGVPSCGGEANAFTPNGKPCLLAANFASAINPATGAGVFGNEGRNSYRGPGFWNADFSLMKYTTLPHAEKLRLGIGAQAFSVFNHPNFDQPNNNLASPEFGFNTLTVGSPTSILGSFLGGDASPRALQIIGRLTF